MMRTYSRKRPNNQLIEDVHELCRLCLNKTMEAMPIFSDNSDNVYAELALRIMICVGLEVTKEECLPNIICAECYNELNKYYAFRKKCEVTYQKLKSHVLAVKEKQYKQRLLAEAKEKEKLEDNVDDDNMKFVVSFDKEQFTSINVLNLNGVAQVNNCVEQKLPELLNMESTDIKVIEPNIEEESQEGLSNPDISTFLSTMLIELGILTQQENGLVYANQNIQSLELETGDGSQVMLELMEEDDVPQDVQEQVEEEVTNETNTPAGVEEELFLDGNCVIKYVTSIANAKRGVRASGGEKKSNGLCCPECGKRLASKSTVTRHMRIHSGEKPYPCQLCGRRFAQKEVLQRHVWVHQQERPHKCGACDKSFTQRRSLESHARAHAPPQARALALHRCDRCPKVFLYASGLSRHMMMHNGRVYVCGACERQFRDKSSLLRHLRNTNHSQPT